MFLTAARIVIAVWLIATAQAALAEKRVALVIGNSNYANVARLPNPVKDARAIAAALTRLGFDVTHLDDLGVGAMRKTLAAFEEKASGADWALVYYAGHGMEMDGKNWVLPVSVNMRRGLEQRRHSGGVRQSHLSRQTIMAARSPMRAAARRVNTGKRPCL